MTGRLDAIKSLIKPAPVIADVGCDHGLIAEYCAESKLAKRVIASDISEMCLDKAKNALRGYDNIEFRCCDGLEYYCDEAIIAGMGGLLIGKILTRAEDLPHTVIVCPHRDCADLRRTLVALGYTIDKDLMCKERGKLYSVMRAEKCAETTQRLGELQMLFGVYYDEKCDLLREYLVKLYNTYMRAPSRNYEKLQPVITAMRIQGVEPDPQST